MPTDATPAASPPLNILAIGGTGFIGAHIVRRLAARGHHVTVLHRGGTEADLPDDVRHVYMDRKRLVQYADSLRAAKPDVVLDTVPFTEQQAADVVTVFRGVAKRTVALSSGDVYRNFGGLRRLETEPPDPVPLAETAPLRSTRYPYRALAKDPSDVLYEYDKILVEQVYGNVPDLPATILRLPMVYGPGDHYHRIYPYLKRMDDGRPAILLDAGEARWHWTRGYVENVAAAVVLAVEAEQAAGRTYNAGRDAALSEAAWVREIGAAAGWDGEVVPMARDVLPPHLRLPFDWRYELAMDARRIRDELGYVAPVPSDEAMRRTIAWERAHPPAIAHEQFNYAAEDAALRQHRAG